MIQAYAIEPEAVVEWAKAPLSGRYILDNFGIGNPALMAEFPKLKNWRKQFRQLSTSLGDLERTRLEELFQRLTQKTICRSGYEYDGTVSWLENAEKEDSRQPFKAIISHTSQGKVTKVLRGNSIGEWPADKWQPERGAIVPRRASDMAAAVGSILYNSSTIIFIDPYLMPAKEEYRNSIQAFLQKCVLNDALSPKSKRIEFHTSADINNAASDQHYKEECEKKISPLLPAGISVTFKRWGKKQDGAKLHNRYILTDIGGVAFPNGLAEGSSQEIDDVSLLTRDQYELRWKQYTSEKPAFDLQFEFTISEIA